MTVKQRIEENFWTSLAAIMFTCIAATAAVVWAAVQFHYDARLALRDDRIQALTTRLTQSEETNEALQSNIERQDSLLDYFRQRAPDLTKSAPSLPIEIENLGPLPGQRSRSLAGELCSSTCGGVRLQLENTSDEVVHIDWWYVIPTSMTFKPRKEIAGRPSESPIEADHVLSTILSLTKPGELHGDRADITIPPHSAINVVIDLECIAQGGPLGGGLEFHGNVIFLGQDRHKSSGEIVISD